MAITNWCRHQESNSGPTDYKSVALPTELYRHTIEIKTAFTYNTIANYYMLDWQYKK